MSIKIAVVMRPDADSLRIYRDNLYRELSALGAEMLPFPEAGPVPAKCDLVWDPGLCSVRRIPIALAKSRAPVVGTMHGNGLKLFDLPEAKVPARGGFRVPMSLIREALVYDWRWYRKIAARTVAVSNYVAGEIIDSFGCAKESLRVVYLGLDHAIFNIHVGWQPYARPYFFTILRNEPYKNMERIFSAYSRLGWRSRPDLVAVIPLYKRRVDIKGVHIIRRALTQGELAKWYCGATAHLTPSLCETFCMPITEAMACGCPVITSNATACGEVAGAAAYLVDPRSTDEISRGMKRLTEDAPLWLNLRRKGLARAKQFTWRKSAKALLKVFDEVIQERRASGRGGQAKGHI